MVASSLASFGAPARLDALELGRGDHRSLAAPAGEQDAAFLEGFSHAGHPELQFRVAALFQLGRRRGRSRGSPSASSSLPPGNTSAPEKASI